MEQAEATVDTSSTEDASGFEAALAALEGATSPDEPSAEEKTGEKPEAKADEKDEETKSFQALRRQRAKLRAERERLAEERASWERERYQSSDETRVAKADAAMLRELRELAKTDRAAVLERLGISYEDLTTDVVGRDTPEARAAAAARQETERLRREIEERDYASSRAAAERSFVSEMTAGGGSDALKAYKEAFGFEPPASELVSLAHQAADQLAREGKAKTLDAIKALVDRHYSDFTKRFGAGRQATKAVVEEAKPSAPTLSKSTSAGSAPTKKADTEGLSLSERIALAEEALSFA